MLTRAASRTKQANQMEIQQCLNCLVLNNFCIPVAGVKGSKLFHGAN